MTRVNLQLACECDAPSAEMVQEWAAAACSHAGCEGEMTIRIVDAEEMSGLNREFRGKEGPTNALAFAFDDWSFDAASDELKLLGDVAICAPVIAAEAAEFGAALMTHYALLVIHGALHLCGYTHDSDEDAEVMEGVEAEVLRECGLVHPHRG